MIKLQSITNNKINIALMLNEESGEYEVHHKLSHTTRFHKFGTIEDALELFNKLAELYSAE